MRTVVTDVRLIDGIADDPWDHVDVVIDGDRISEIEPHLPDRPGLADPPTVVIDGAGATMLPGLIDAHAHYTFDPTEGSIATIARRPDAEIALAAAGHAARALRAGITTARGAGSVRNLEVALRDAIVAGLVPGPRLIVAGTAVGITGGHGHQFGLEADGPDALVSATRRVIRDGADVVKVIASEAAMLTTTGLAPGRMVHGAPELREDELRAIVGTAAETGIAVMSHAQDSESVRRSAGAGVRSVEHAWLADRAAIEAVARSGAWLVPTLVVTDVNRTLPGLSAIQRERQDLIERSHRASTEAAIGFGIRLATGTDTGEVGVTSDMVWREIALLHEHGATPMAAIKAATSSAALLLRVDDLVGTVEVGKVADLLLVDGDPLTDLRRLSTPRTVIQAGSIIG
jgi:imidazolonepropionase-like amidohydrolase